MAEGRLVTGVTSGPGGVDWVGRHGTRPVVTCGDCGPGGHNDTNDRCVGYRLKRIMGRFDI